MSLFAGVGGFDLALERCGHTVTDQVEIDRHARAVLARRFPTARLHEDIHDFTPDIRVPMGPGERRGDARDRGRGVTDATKRDHTGDMEAASGEGDRPSTDIVVGGFPCQDYSVAGTRGGLAGDRGALWWQMHRVVAESNPLWVVGENVPGLLSSNDGADFRTIVWSLVELGYGVVWRVLDAQYFGVAQRRRRVFIVAHSGGVPRPEVLAVAEGCTGDSPPRREAGSRVAALTANGVGGGGGPDDNAAQAGHLIAPDTVGALRTRDAKGTPIDVAEPALIGSFAWQAAGNNDASGAFNGPDQATPTLPVSQTMAVAFAQNQRDEVRDLGANGHRTDAIHVGQTPAIAQTFDWQAGSSGDTSFRGKSRSWIMDEPGRTRSLTANRTLALASPQVRRLTPVECERLQGFPDGWTAGQSDTQRYRQLGNAVAVPVVEWIIRRLTEAKP